MAVCSKCGVTIPDNSPFCTSCGAQQPASKSQAYFQEQVYGAPGSPSAPVPQPGLGQPQPPYQTHPGMAPQYPVFLYPPDGVSPKPRDAVILLSFFLGIYGGHRFYLGKYGTAILMIFTLGGFGIWYLIDFFNAIFGTYKDSEGRFVDKHYTKALGVALIVILCVGALYMIFVWGLIMREIQSGSF